MKRRAFVTGLGAVFAAPLAAEARKSARIGWVGAWYSPSAAASLFDAFRAGMRELGYIEGQNLTIDARWMEQGTLDEAARLTTELVRSNVDVLVAQGPAVPGVKTEAGSIPVVFGFSGDPVAAKIVAGLARPGGNLTGFTLLAVELAAKRVELLKEAVPRVSRVAVLTNPRHPGEDEELREAQLAAQRLGLSLQPFPVRTIAEVNAPSRLWRTSTLMVSWRYQTCSSCISGTPLLSSPPSNESPRSPGGKTSQSTAIS